MDELIERLVAHFDFLSARDDVIRLSGGSNGAVYRSGDYIVKISTLRDSAQFEREGATMECLRDKLNVSRVFVVDTSHKLIPRNFIIQSYVAGPLLAECWDRFSPAEKEKHLRQICDQIRQIHELAEDLAPPLRVDEIRWYLDSCAQRDVIPTDILEKLRRYVDIHGHLASKNPVITHGDLQFYNMILSERGTAIYFIDFDSVFAAARERDLLALASTAFSYDAATTHHIDRSHSNNLVVIREYCPEWFASDQAVETMRLFSVPRVCYTFDASVKSGLNPRPSERKGRLLYHLFFDDPVWEAYMKGERVDLS